MPTGQELFDAEIAKIKLKIKDSPSAAVTKRLVRQLRNLQQKTGNWRIGIDAKGGTKGRVAVDTGKQAHHRTSLNNAAAFFEDLDIPEKVIMGQTFAQYGLTPGDVTLNRLDMFARLHQGGIHALERALDLESKQYFKPGASLKEKLLAVEAFAADQKLLASIADRMQFTAEFQTSGLTTRVESTATSELAAEYSEKGARRLKGQKADFLKYIPEQHEVATALGPQHASNNDARLAALDRYFNPDGSLDVAKLKADKSAGKFRLPKAGRARPVGALDINKGAAKLNHKTLRRAAQGLAVAGTLAPSVFGIGASAAEVGFRKQIADESDNPLDDWQLGLASASLAGDLAGPWGEVVSTPADLVNTGIDEVRSFIDDPVGHVSGRVKESTRTMLTPYGFGPHSPIDPLDPIGSVKKFIPGTKEQQQHHEETIEKAEQVIGVVNGSIRWLGDQWNQNWANHPLNPDRKKEDKLSVGFAEGGF